MAGRVHSGFYPLMHPKGSSHPATSWLSLGGLNQKFEAAKAWLHPHSLADKPARSFKYIQRTAKAVVLKSSITFGETDSAFTVLNLCYIH